MHPLVERARREKTPLIEGNTATFVWKGTTAPFLKGDWTHWDDPIALMKIAPAVWTHTTTFDPTAYVEYAYFATPDEEERVTDPFNPRRIANGIGHHNYFFGMPAYQPMRFRRALSPSQGARGTVTRHIVRHPGFAGGKRALWLYAPPTEQPVPLLLVWDGYDYLRRASLPTLVDHLIARGQMRPHAIALLQNGGDARFLEYATTEPTLFALESVLKVAHDHLNLIDVAQNPGAYAVLGASFGGLMAMFAGIRLPFVFGTVISQAGDFDMAPSDDSPSIIRLLVEALPRLPLRIWQDVGTMDWLLGSNRTFRDALQAKGYDVTYREYAAGHNFTAWRGALVDAFTTMLSS